MHVAVPKKKKKKKSYTVEPSNKGHFWDNMRLFCPCREAVLFSEVLNVWNYNIGKVIIIFWDPEQCPL